ncbi:hypothetical protein EGW08_006076 [Elysia chlorotica]|uniref:Alpha-1,4-N-acetylglucosaminyltransferase n=1 Tax=Elysia chlorotica TaxID=188477 RepID=A0A3S0ZUJ1_ELYCH|nr:hypothetical protein EGW08_006076 [Elysia chlorotica]
MQGTEMTRQHLLLCLAALMHIAIFVYVHKGTIQGSPDDDFFRKEKKTRTLDPENVSSFSFIPACKETLHEIVASLPSSRWRLEIQCGTKAEVGARKRNVPADTSPYNITWAKRSPSLQKFVEHFCYEFKGQRIPSLVHYVWFGRNYFRPEHLMSVLSAIRYINPCAVLFHSDRLPFGDHWRLLLQLVPEVIHVIHRQPENIFGHRFGFIQHKADIVRLQVLFVLGGIYLDGDQLVTAPLTPFLHHGLVMSHENSANLANSMILASPGARLLSLWLARYRTYNSSQWGTHSTYVPWELAKQYPSLIKVVENRFVNPDLTDIGQVYYGHYDISRNLGLHLYTRFLRKPLPLLGVAQWDSSLGQVWRDILYGSPERVSSFFSFFRAVKGDQGDLALHDYTSVAIKEKAVNFFYWL